MTIKVNCKLLSEQINLCDSCGTWFCGAEVSKQFEGIASLLSQICFAVEEGESVVFEREDGV